MHSYTLTNPQPISESQLEAFRSLETKKGLALVNNVRAPQDLNGRVCSVFYDVNFYWRCLLASLPAVLLFSNTESQIHPGDAFEKQEESKEKRD